MANTLIIFVEKMWVALAMQKLLTFFEAKISMYLEKTLATTVNKFVINTFVKLMMLWKLDPELDCDTVDRLIWAFTGVSRWPSN